MVTQVIDGEYFANAFGVAPQVFEAEQKNGRIGGLPTNGSVWLSEGSEQPRPKRAEQRCGRGES